MAMEISIDGPISDGVPIPFIVTVQPTLIFFETAASPVELDSRKPRQGTEPDPLQNARTVLNAFYPGSFPDPLRLPFYDERQNGTGPNSGHGTEAARVVQSDRSRRTFEHDQKKASGIDHAETGPLHPDRFPKLHLHASRFGRVFGHVQDHATTNLTLNLNVKPCISVHFSERLCIPHINVFPGS
jgi:hypothetical protein